MGHRFTRADPGEGDRGRDDDARAQEAEAKVGDQAPV
jgi:hypothetical protein